MNFGDKVKYCRKEMNLTQLEFSKKLNITRGYLSDIERGRIKGSVSLLSKVSEVTGKAIMYFMDDDIIVNPYETLDEAINLLINSKDILPSGEISDWGKEVLLKVLEKEIKLKLERRDDN